jgi:adenosylcobinamide kinase/adenosylcobinamide-phosphate guanylyltransferase
MAKIIFIVGGARSGKSTYALSVAKASGKKIAFIATCQPKDCEMKKRITLHKNSRPCHWKTFEEPRDPVLLLKKIGLKFDVVVIDCLTLMISNLMLKGLKEAAIESKINKLLDVLNKIKAQSVIVSNEVGLGIVPQNKLARDFRDIAGRINQIVAAKSDSVIFLVSGIPWRIK